MKKTKKINGIVNSQSDFKTCQMKKKKLPLLPTLPRPAALPPKENQKGHLKKFNKK